MPRLLCVCALGLAGWPVAGARPADSAALMVTYIGSSSLQVTLGSTPIGSGATIPAGSYQVIVSDPDDTNPDFVMSGPGVSIVSNLNSSGMGIDEPAFFGPYMLQPSSTYTLEDGNIGASSSFAFSTSATATASGGSSSGGFSSVSTAGSSSTGAGGSAASATSTSSPPAASATKILGTLIGSVSVSGRPALTLAGKSVRSLKAGLYRLTVQDHSKKARLLIEKLGSPVMTFGGTASGEVGSHDLTLSAGRWFFASSTAGPKTYFDVA